MIRKSRLALAMLFIWLAASCGLAMSQDHQRIRKSIDSLTQEELDNYLHALAIVMKRDPTTVGSYEYYAALHNDAAVGPCEHISDTFLPWHRAHLYEFESELRASDPPRTSNVTIPYWNWSALPSGVRYPKAFETDPLLRFEGRNTKPICKGTPDGSCDRLPFPWSELDETVLSIKSWSSPAENFGSYSGNRAVECRDRAGGGYGSLENPPHNTMHSSYVGGFMASGSTSAKDPIFWSYHAFIDLLFVEWQKREGHTVDTCLNCKLCGLNWTVQSVVDAAGQLNVSYDFTPTAVVTTASIEDGWKPLSSVDMALSATEKFVARHKTLVSIPSAAVTKARGVVHEVRIASPVTYQVNAFLYPKALEGSFDPKDRATRERYIVYVGTVWQQHHRNGLPNPRLMQTLDFDLVTQLNALVPKHAGETWVLDVRTYLAPNAAAETHVHHDTLEAEPVDKVLDFGGVALSTE
ncbi:tyrosinase family protein [Rhizobium leguminosarum]|uniref:tyrosinase family protein n=1 Tax=Rhizobium leguminosarum TaxID=384 RepID=UPI001C9847A2|nr:tyrosinase family protein [Rhizobium leguminosarum]MBY5560566.1 tyrosinase family protein [Rhizobium leguminosarum]MBY5708912.1 tyrosinase family protein [Rhizobium leguminosarum]